MIRMPDELITPSERRQVITVVVAVVVLSALMFAGLGFFAGRHV